ncbi:hypothetical protein CSIRO_1005 [Bradyrhizobiaceae bacterium SG-6C]|nr:hypothetical protein CSIRO_1005 [Bradyrhizobiaceae bacterium SG-6C]
MHFFNCRGDFPVRTKCGPRSRAGQLEKLTEDQIDGATLRE